MNRPLVWVGLALAAGTYAASLDLSPGLLLPAAIILAGVALPIVLNRYPGARTASVLVCFLGLGALLWNLRHWEPSGDPFGGFLAEHTGRAVELEGRIRSVYIMLPGTARTSFLFDVDRVSLEGQWELVRGAIMVRWGSATSPLFADERLRIRGVVEQDIGQVNPDIDGVEDYYRRQGVRGVVRVARQDAVERLAPARWTSLRYWASRLRDLQARQLAQSMPPSIAPFILAVWLGDRGGMSAAEYQSYVESGTAHILSVSGIHMAIVFTTFSYLVRMRVRSRRVRGVIGLIVVVVFTLVSGARIATVRSALMIAAYLLADLCDRERDVRTALSLSGILLLLVDPDCLFDTGFQLSFLSVASILMGQERIAAALTWLYRPVREAFATSLSAQFLTLPLVIATFNVLPILSPFANLLVVPLLTGVLWLTFLTAACALVWPDAALLFGHALLPFVYAIRTTANAMTGHLNLTSPTVAAMVFYWGALVWLTVPTLPAVLPKVHGGTRFVASPISFFFRNIYAGSVDVSEKEIPLTTSMLRLGRHSWGVAVFLAVLMAVCWRPWSLPPRVVFLDVGHGDAAFIRTPQRATVLIDAGNRYGDVDRGARLVAPFLWANHTTRVDCIVVTHPDRDHIGGVLHIIEHFSVGTVVLGAIPSEREDERDLLERCAELQVPVRRVYRGQSIKLPGALLEVLNPPENASKNSPINDRSLVVRLVWPGVSVLFAGDIESAAEKELLPLNCAAEILKVPHHGSDTSSSVDFIHAVRPRHCVISTGRHATGKLLDAVVLHRYEAAGVTIWRTDVHGGIDVRFPNGVPRITGEREKRGYLPRD